MPPGRRARAGPGPGPRIPGKHPAHRRPAGTVAQGLSAGHQGRSRPRRACSSTSANCSRRPAATMRPQRIYESARAADPDDPRLHANLGSLALARDQHERAVLSFGEAIKLDPACIEALHGLGITFLEQGRSGEAETCFREVLRLNPKNGLTLSALARLEAERGDLEQSCDTAREALSVRPHQADAYTRLAINLKGPTARGRGSGDHAAARPQIAADSGARDAAVCAGRGLRCARSLYREAAAQFRSGQPPAGRGQGRPGPRLRRRAPLRVRRPVHLHVHARSDRPCPRLGRARPAPGFRCRATAVGHDPGRADPRVARPGPRRRRAF